MDPICIENNPDGDSDSRDCNDEKDLIFKKFDDGAFKHRFKPLWADSDYDVTKIEVIIVNWEEKANDLHMGMSKEVLQAIALDFPVEILMTWKVISITLHEI